MGDPSTAAVDAMANQSRPYYFQGQIDKVAIFDTALTSASAAAIFDARNGGMCQPWGETGRMP